MTEPAANGLTGTTSVPVMVRVVVDRNWSLRWGELVDVDEVSRGRFVNWSGLVPALRRFLDEERQQLARSASVGPNVAAREPEGSV